MLQVFQSLSPSQLRNLAALFGAGLLFWTSLTSMLPTLPAYIADVGGTPQQVGLVMGCFAIGLLVFRSRLGQMADRRSRKLVVLIGAAVVGTAPLFYLATESIPLLMLSRCFHGISIAAFTTGYSTLVVDIAPPHKRGELIGYMSLVVPIGMAIGPAVGGSLQASVGYVPLFLVSAAAGYLSLLFASGVSESEESQKDLTPDSEDGESFWELVLSPRLQTPALMLLLIGLAFGTLAYFLPLFVRELSFEFNAGWFYSTAAIASFTARIVLGRASDRFGRGVFISFSLLSYTVAMLLLATAQAPAQLLGAAVAQGFGGGTLIPMTVALMSDRSNARERGRVYSICLSGFDLGIALAGPGLGSFAGILGYRGLYWLSMTLAGGALALFATRSSKNLSHSLRFAIGQERDIYALKPGRY